MSREMKTKARKVGLWFDSFWNSVIAVYFQNNELPISCRVDRAFATEAVDLGSIPGRVKPNRIKIAIHGFPA